MFSKICPSLEKANINILLRFRKRFVVLCVQWLTRDSPTDRSVTYLTIFFFFTFTKLRIDLVWVFFLSMKTEKLYYTVHRIRPNGFRFFTKYFKCGGGIPGGGGRDVLLFASIPSAEPTTVDCLIGFKLTFFFFFLFFSYKNTQVNDFTNT